MRTLVFHLDNFIDNKAYKLLLKHSLFFVDIQFNNCYNKPAELSNEEHVGMKLAMSDCFLILISSELFMDPKMMFYIKIALSTNKPIKFVLMENCDYRILNLTGNSLLDISFNSYDSKNRWANDVLAKIRK